MANNKLQKQAANAADALHDAQKKQSAGDYEGAEKDIEKARKQLGENKSQDQSGENKNDGGSPEDQSGNKPEKTPTAGQEKNKIDNKQADALLENMSQDEKNLRDAIRANQRQRRMTPVEKDW